MESAGLPCWSMALIPEGLRGPLQEPTRRAAGDCRFHRRLRGTRAGSGAQFAKQAPFFATRFRVIVPDACGQGRTADREGPLSYHAMAEDVLALLDRPAIDRADVMGWSDGGIVGLGLAMNRPGRVNHLVAFGANFRPDGLNPADQAWAELWIVPGASHSVIQEQPDLVNARVLAFLQR
jgi:pimeloyl-ACP methyl ester carboxylesterase